MLRKDYRMPESFRDREPLRDKLLEQFSAFDQSAVLLNRQYQGALYWQAILPFIITLFLALGFYPEDILGALPVPDDLAAYRNFRDAIKTRCEQGCCITVYPEAHIWPYYTKIRPFPDTSFDYPAKLGAPVFTFTNTYRRRRFFRHPRIVTCVDGPFFPDMEKPVKKRRAELRDKAYRAMTKRSEFSDHVQIKYIKQEKKQ